MALLSISPLVCVAPVKAVLGESPLWDPRINNLIFLDIKGNRLITFDPKSRQADEYATTGMISALGLARKGGYICAYENGFARLHLENSKIKIDPIIDPEPDISGNRFNDGKVDPTGGFWAGTMDDAEQDPRAGSWWRLAPDGACKLVDDNYHVTNGPAFDRQNDRVYLTDSAAQIIYVADTNGKSIQNKRSFLQFQAGDGYPDGMDIDSQGFLWVAFWDGGVVRRFSPAGVLAQEISIDAPRPTSVKLVGNLLFVTTARRGLSAEALEKFPGSGGLFEAELSESIGETGAPFFED